MKRSQLRMGETIAVLTIFFFLLVFGFSFYVRVQKHYYSGQVERMANLRALQIAQVAAYMPEFQCSIQNVQDDNCFDILKVDIFSSLLASNDSLRTTYFDVLGFSSLNLREVYPDDGRNWTLYENLLNDSTSTIKSMIPVSIFDGQQRKYSIGILEVTVSSST